MAISPDYRRLFDQILDRLIEELPAHIRSLLEEVPLIVEDEPGQALGRRMGLDRRGTELCGLYWGVPLSERSVLASGALPDRMMLFRGPITRIAGYRGRSGDLERLERQMRTTLLHEIGHHFGLDEEDLTALGYG